MYRIASLLTFLVFIVTTSLPALASDQIGTVIAIEGNARLILPSGDEAPLAFKDPISLYDFVETDDNTRLLIIFNDGSELTLGENASFIVDEYIFDLAKDEKASQFSILRGAFAYVSGLIGKTQSPNVKIQTSYGQIDVQDTAVWGGELKDRFGVLVKQGYARLLNDAGETTLSQNQGSFISEESAAPSPANEWSDDNVQAALATVTFTDTNRLEENREALARDSIATGN